MTSGTTGATGATGPTGQATDERLSRVFLGILAVELLAIAGLYWVGLHFTA